MNWKAWAPLAVAIVLGMVAAITARNLVSRRPVVVAAGPGAQVVVVKQSVLPGQAIKDDDVAMAALAWKETPEGTFKNKADVVGRVATLPLVKGEPVLESVLAPAGSGTGLQALVPEGMRAISIEVNEVSSVAGLITPGCSVDVVATIDDGKTKERVARTIVQDVKVMAVGQRVSAPPASVGKDAAKDAAAAAADQMFKSVTLLTTPAEAEALELASMIGRPRLVLRGGRDLAMAKTSGVSVAELCGNAGSDASADLLTPGHFAEVTPAMAVQPVARPTTRPAGAVRVVKVIRGGVESTVTFPADRPASGAAAAEPMVPPPAAPGGTVLTGADAGLVIK